MVERVENGWSERRGGFEGPGGGLVGGGKLG